MYWNLKVNCPHIKLRLILGYSLLGGQGKMNFLSLVSWKIVYVTELTFFFLKQKKCLVTLKW